MQDFGQSMITTEDDVDTLAFDWGTIHMLAEEGVTGGKSMSFGAGSTGPRQVPRSP